MSDRVEDTPRNHKADVYEAGYVLRHAAPGRAISV